MLQIYIALIIIAFFLGRTFWQKKNNKISRNEAIFWISFWILAAVFMFLIKRIDAFVAGLGFSATGIDVLSYFSIAIIFYLIFKIIVRMEKIEKNVTEIIRKISLKDYK